MNLIQAIKKNAFNSLKVGSDGISLYYVINDSYSNNLEFKKILADRNNIEYCLVLFPVITNLRSEDFVIKIKNKKNRRFVFFNSESNLFYKLNDYNSVLEIPKDYICNFCNKNKLNPFETFDELYLLNNWFPLI